MHVDFPSYSIFLSPLYLYVSQKRDFREETATVLSSVRGLLDDHAQPGGNTGTNLQVTSTHMLSQTDF